MINKLVKNCTTNLPKIAQRICQKMHKCIEKNIKICYSKKQVNLMKLTKKGYMPRLIEKVYEVNNKNSAKEGKNKWIQRLQKSKMKN